jgi:hypothetical protein
LTFSEVSSTILFGKSDIAGKEVSTMLAGPQEMVVQIGWDPKFGVKTSGPPTGLSIWLAVFR